MKSYDLVIVGSGSGLVVLETALAQGLRCAMIERSKFGGTCLTKGCIPSKMLVHPADLIRETQEAWRIGLPYTQPEPDWGRISDRMWRRIDYNERIEQNLDQTPGLDLYKGTGEFTGPRTMVVRYADGTQPEELTAERFVVAVGARSFVPPIQGLEEAGYITSESFFGPRFPKKPWRSLIIVGGGAIGAEFAHIFSAFGTKVTLLEMRPHILPTEEEEISVFVEKQFKRNGIDVYTNTAVISADADGDGKRVVIEDRETGTRKTISAEEIFIASGVRSNGDSLRLDLAGVETDDRGWIVTNEYLETSQPHIFAIGDINGKYQFRHTANHEAGILEHNLFTNGERKRMRYDAVPWAVFTWPQVGHVGLTEREAREKGFKIGIARNRYSDIAGGMAMGYSAKSEDNGFVKIILSRDMRVLGVHIVGPYAAMLVQPFVYLIHSGCSCANLEAIQEVAASSELRQQIREACLRTGGLQPLMDSMVIHPSMNELAAWALEEIEWDT